MRRVPKKKQDNVSKRKTLGFGLLRRILGKRQDSTISFCLVFGFRYLMGCTPEYTHIYIFLNDLLGIAQECC